MAVRVDNPGGHLKRTIVLDTISIVSFSEAPFSYEGGAVGSIEVSFPISGELPGLRSAFDNLTFRAPPHA